MKCVRFLNRKTGTGAAAILLAASVLTAAPVYAAEDTGLGVDMSTDYPGITVKAGETVSFPLDFISLDGESYDVDLSAGELPENWSGYFKGGSSQITKVHVDGDSKKSDETGDLADFSLSVPAEAQDGTYEVELEADAGAGRKDKLLLEVTVSVEQAGESNFTSEYPEQQGASGTSFSFDTTLVNNRGTNQSYSLSAQTPEGWQAAFTPSGETNAVASLSVDAGGSQGVTVSVTPPER